jgi:uncharacterized protein (TIGR02996 family)
MDERRALMAAIIADPDEDTPRLAFADWLQENGDEHDQARAEFIRLQIEEARLPEGDPSRTELEKRAAKLRKKHAKHWIGALAKFEQYPMFERGLLFQVDLSPRDFLKPARQRALIEWLPLVGTNLLKLTGHATKADQVAASPVLGLVPALLWWFSDMTDAELKALAKSPHTSRLTSLNLRYLAATDTGLKALAKSPRFAGLRRLRLLSPLRGGEGITAKGIRALIASDKFPQLDTFVLTGMSQFKSHVKMPALCAEPALSRLKSLYLYLVQESPTPVFRCPYLTNLEELQIHCEGNTGEEVTEADIDALLANPAFAKLRRFAVDNSLDNQLKDRVIARLRKRFGDGFSTDTDLQYV